jgi:hypothetical protein
MLAKSLIAKPNRKGSHKDHKGHKGHKEFSGLRVFRVLRGSKI